MPPCPRTRSSLPVAVVVVPSRGVASRPVDRDAPSPRTPSRGAQLPAGAVLAALAAGGVLAGRTASSLRRMRQAATSVEVARPRPRPARPVPGAPVDRPRGFGGGRTRDRVGRRRVAAPARTCLGRDGTAVEVRCLAADGATARDVARRAGPGLGPSDAVVVGVGVNDALRRHPVAMVRGDTRELLQAVARPHPDAAVVLVTCPDLGVAPGLPTAVRGVVGWRCAASRTRSRGRGRARRPRGPARPVGPASGAVRRRRLPPGGRRPRAARRAGGRAPPRGRRRPSVGSADAPSRGRARDRPNAVRPRCDPPRSRRDVRRGSGAARPARHLARRRRVRAHGHCRRSSRGPCSRATHGRRRA
jgi:hypothetical protein